MTLQHVLVYCALAIGLMLAAARLVEPGAEPPPGAAESAGDGAVAPAELPAEPFAGGIIGSKHDFSDGGRLPQDLCTPCHTPHITAAQAPLLVKRSAAAERTRAYGAAAGELSAASLVCLSCHDGTVARDVYAGTHAMTFAELTEAGLAAGRTRLRNHPVGIEYPVGDPKYNSPEAVGAEGRILLPGGRIQCTTCHDPHNTRRNAGMLVISNDRSRLCLSCHRL